MQPGNNPIETHKAAKGGEPLRIREDLPRLIQQGWEALSPADKELLKWVGVFFRKPTPGQFMMRIQTAGCGSWLMSMRRRPSRPMRRFPWS